jgi:non-heme chloroperoxidase
VFLSCLDKQPYLNVNREVEAGIYFLRKNLKFCPFCDYILKKHILKFSSIVSSRGCFFMAKVTVNGVELFYKDWGKGQPVVFSHGWPLSSDAFEDQMFYLSSRGYRCIAHDRRGHGRSSQPWTGHDMDTYADDLSGLIEELDLKDTVLVGHSTGGGEVTRYLGRHGTGRVSKAVLISAIPPLMLKTQSNPGGLPIEAFNQIRQAIIADRSQFFKDLSMQFYGYNRQGANVSEGVRNSFWLQGMICSFPAAYFCVQVFSETDLTEDLKKINVPTLILHGDDDQIVPIADSAYLSAKIVKESILKVYKGAPHGICTTHKQQVNEDLLAFIKGELKPEKKEAQMQPAA